MSRGLGWVQRECLRALDGGRQRALWHRWLSVNDLSLHVFLIPPDPSQRESLRRALHGLKARGLVELSLRDELVSASDAYYTSRVVLRHSLFARPLLTDEETAEEAELSRQAAHHLREWRLAEAKGDDASAEQHRFWLLNHDAI